MKNKEKIKYVCFHVWMMNESFLNVKTDDEKYKIKLQNILLSSFLMYSRSIIDFLFKENPRKDDISCKDFLNNEEVKILQKDKIEFEEIKTKIEKQIIHLTTVKIDKNFPRLKIKNKINKKFKCFLEKQKDYFK
jgi:hypothetical protein